MRMLVIGLRAICCALLFALIAMPFAQIIMRGIFNVPMAGAEELTRYFLICLTFMAGALVTVEGGQIRMEEFQGMLPERVRFALQLVIDAAGGMVFAYVAYAAVVTTLGNLTNKTATLEMPFWLFMAPLSLGMALLAGATMAQFVRIWRRGRSDDKHTTLT
ncbi:MAG: TRAP transporter small permease [Beijerinckiaceae bacterium]